MSFSPAICPSRAGNTRRALSRPLDDRAFRQVLEESGGFFWNAFTSLDQTVYFELGLASDVHELLRLEGARMLHPIVRVPDAVARTELDVVKNELHYRNETG